MSTNEVLATLAADINYFQGMVESECNKIKTELIEKINKEADPYSHLNIVAGHLIEAIGLITARVQLLESTLASQLNHSVTDNLPSIETPQHVMQFVDEIVLGSENFGNKINFYGSETTDSGLTYAWSGPSPINNFDVPVNRDVEKFGQFRFISIVDESLLNGLIVRVDGQSVAYRLGFYENQQVIEFSIEAREQKQPTKLSLILAKTISPQEEGIGQDARTLGIALSGVSVSEISII